MLAALVGRSLARTRGLLWGAAALLAAFQVSIVLQAASYQDRQAFETLGRMVPAVIQRWLGEGMFALGSFGGVISFGFFHPMVVLLVSMVAAFLASEPAADVEDGYVDLLLARPVARHLLVTRSALLLAGCPVALALLMMLATWITAALSAPPAAQWPSVGTTLTLAAHLVAVAWCFGGLALLLSAGARRRASGFTPVALAAVALYFVNVLAASWAPARVVDVVSPFHYYQGARVLAGLTDPARDLLVLGAAAGVLVGVAYRRFAARDL